MGYFLAFLTAIFQSINTSITKHSIKKVDVFVLALVMRLIGLLTVLPLLLINPIPNLNYKFWLAAILIGLLSTLSDIFRIKAIQLSPISLVAPITAFSPVFLLITTPFILGEFPSLIGLLGIILVILGSYLIHFESFSHHLLKPFKTIFKQAGVKFMLLTTFIWSLESNVHKIGIKNSSVAFWTVTQFAVISFTLIIYLLLTKKTIRVTKPRKIAAPLVLIGLIAGLGQIAQMQSLSMILAVYAITIKRLSILLTIVLGWLFFKETNIKKKLVSASIMIIGVIIISISG